MSDEFDAAFFARMRDRLESEFDWFGMDEDNTVECLRAAFEFARSPKPDEPQGLGAVVEDAGGEKWVRGSTAQGLKAWINDDALDGEWRSYTEIAAVRVLSEGVSSND